VGPVVKLEEQDVEKEREEEGELGELNEQK